MKKCLNNWMEIMKKVNVFELACSIERVRLAEKFMTENMSGFQMQYAIDLLRMALPSLENLISISNHDQENSKQFEKEMFWIGGDE